MKKFTSILAVLAAMFICVGAMTGCTGGSDEETKNPASSTPAGSTGSTDSKPGDDKDQGSTDSKPQEDSKPETNPEDNVENETKPEDNIGNESKPEDNVESETKPEDYNQTETTPEDGGEMDNEDSAESEG